MRLPTRRKKLLRRRRKLQRRRPSESSSLCIADFLNKGKRKELDFILVQGTISTTQWTDRQGESHTQISINADSIAFVNAGKKRSRTTTRRGLPREGLRRSPLSATAGCSRTRREGLAILTMKGGRNEICKAFRSLSWILGH